MTTLPRLLLCRISHSWGVSVATRGTRQQAAIQHDGRSSCYYASSWTSCLARTDFQVSGLIHTPFGGDVSCPSVCVVQRWWHSRNTAAPNGNLIAPAERHSQNAIAKQRSTTCSYRMCTSPSLYSARSFSTRVQGFQTVQWLVSHASEYPQTSLELLRAKIRRAAGRGAGGRAGARHGVTAGPQHRAAAARAQPVRF
jgi:hypothetical protein